VSEPTEYTDAQILIYLRQALVGGLQRKGKKVSINNRSIESFDLAEIQALIAEYEARVLPARQRRNAVIGFGRV